MPATTSTSLDMRGKTITTFIVYEALTRLTGLADGETLHLLTDASDEIDNDIRAWCRTRGQELASARHTDSSQQYLITKQPLLPSGKRYAAVSPTLGWKSCSPRSASPLPPPWPTRCT